MNSATATPGPGKDLLLLGCLILAGLVIKTWLIGNSLMFARDGVGFIELAQCFQEQPWGEVLRQSHQHPLYPMNIWTVSRGYSAAVQRPLTNVDWQNCAHLANAWASLAAIIPMFFLGKRLGGRWVGFAGGLLFILLPMPALVLADTLSEGTYLLCLLTGTWAAVRGFELRQPLWFLFAGVAGGLAFLARPEGAMLPVVAGLTLIALMLKGTLGMRWSSALTAGALLCVGTLLITGPYWYTIGGLGKKTTFQEMLDVAYGVSASAEEECEAAGNGFRESALLFASRFQPGTDGKDWAHLNALLVAREVIKEVMCGHFYLVYAFALVGLVLVLRRPELRSQRGPTLMIFMGCFSYFLLFWLAWKARYVSERHTLFIVLVGCWFAALALQTLSAYLAVRFRPLCGRARLLANLALLVLITFSLFKLMDPPHQQRLAHRDAGLWLRKKLLPGDEIIDPYGYVAFFAEQRNVYKKKLPRSDRNRTYLVLEPGETDWYRLRLASKVRERGELVRSWPATEPRVIIYRSRAPSGPPTLTAVAD